MPVKTKLLNDFENKKSNYPILMIRDSDRLVVLFHAEGMGTALIGNVPGYYSQEWIMGEFYPCNGTVQISNRHE